jgi:hypothetical protein
MSGETFQTATMPTATDVLVAEQPGRRAREMPRQHDDGKLPDALEGVGQEGDDGDDREGHHAQVREHGPPAAPEPGLDPFGAG